MAGIEKQRSAVKWYITGGVPGFDLNSLPRCRAIAKSTGKRCGNPAMKGKDTCCVHSGLYNPGPLLGNQHALKHGFYTSKAIAERKEAQKFLRDTEEILSGIQF